MPQPPLLKTDSPADKTASHTTHARQVLKRRLAMLSRWLHIYLSMASFAIVFFFAVTGLTLNHTDWFADQQSTAQLKGNVESKWVKTDSDDKVAKLEIVEQLRRTHGIKAALSEFRIDESQCAVSFKGPGYSADVFVNRESGEYDLTENRLGFVAIMNDLHKGRDTGRAWAKLIDVSAIFMTLVSLTGMALIFFLKRWRASGLIVTVVGGVVCWLVYWLWVS
ncbi:MAG: PepSY-associated TM helix domain-containing protein [Acidobacteria bacterium]|nr:PepSY-associated TM helix domain-containing protein [Acidobacteriota bacterium]